MVVAKEDELESLKHQNASAFSTYMKLNALALEFPSWMISLKNIIEN
jgi:hypothetical protein